MKRRKGLQDAHVRERITYLATVVIPAKLTEVGECLLWEGWAQHGSPQVYAGGRYLQARRVMWEHRNGPIAPGLSPVMKCREPLCLVPGHMELRTIAGIAQLAASEGRFSTPQRRAAIVAGRRAKAPGKLTPDDVQAVLTSGESTKVLATRYGVNESWITRLRNQGAGQPCANASVFTWRPAA